MISRVRSRVADEVRQEELREVLALSPEERMRLALELGTRDLRVYAEAAGISLEEARRRVDATRAAGRRPSVANAR